MVPMKKNESLEGHIVVCGYGKIGEKVCEVLEEHNKEYLVIDQNPSIAKLLMEMKVNVVGGDATHSRVLKMARIEKARGLVTTFANDTTNVYVILTARELNQNLLIASRAVSDEVVSKMHRAGASIVVLPEVVGGMELGREIVKKKLKIGSLKV
ncbi:MAG: NAD-binding protein [Candidatus Micrarchaeota archaeon]|nr:NAD-binding protein [Candidatus Micrarchaeota archaeon]